MITKTCPLTEWYVILNYFFEFVLRTLYTVTSEPFLLNILFLLISLVFDFLEHIFGHFRNQTLIIDFDS